MLTADSRRFQSARITTIVDRSTYDFSIPKDCRYRALPRPQRRVHATAALHRPPV